MSNPRLLAIKAWFHEEGLRFERWLDPITGLFQDQPPEEGLTFIQATREKIELGYQLAPSTRLFLVPLGSPVPARQLALVRPLGRSSSRAA